MFNKPEPKKEEKPKGRVVMESIAIGRFVEANKKSPHNREELVKWVKEQYGSTAEVS